MLGKLLKYEFRATAKTFIGIYAAVLVVAFVNMLFQPWSDWSAAEIPIVGIDDGDTQNLIATVLFIVFGAILVALAAITVVTLVQRFSNNLLGREGYLMFSLPVRSDALIGAKLIASLVWCCGSALCVVLSILILFCRVGIFMGLSRVWGAMLDEHINLAYWIPAGILSVLCTFVLMLLAFYAAAAVGPHITKNRTLGSIIAFLGIFIAFQITYNLICLVTGTTLFPALDAYTNDAGQLMAQHLNGPDTPVTAFPLLSNLATTAGAPDAARYSYGLMAGANLQWLFLCIIFAAGCYVLCRWFLTKKLNLE